MSSVPDSVRFIYARQAPSPFNWYTQDDYRGCLVAWEPPDEAIAGYVIFRTAERLDDDCAYDLLEGYLDEVADRLDVPRAITALVDDQVHDRNRYLVLARTVGGDYLTVDGGRAEKLTPGEVEGLEAFAFWSNPDGPQRNREPRRLDYLAIRPERESAFEWHYPEEIEALTHYEFIVSRQPISPHTGDEHDISEFRAVLRGDHGGSFKLEPWVNAVVDNVTEPGSYTYFALLACDAFGCRIQIPMRHVDGLRKGQPFRLLRAGSDGGGVGLDRMELAYEAWQRRRSPEAPEDEPEDEPAARDAPDDDSDDDDAPPSYAPPAYAAPAATPPAYTAPPSSMPPAYAAPASSAPPAYAPPSGATPPAYAPPSGATPPAYAPPAGTTPPPAYSAPPGTTSPAYAPPGGAPPANAPPAYAPLSLDAGLEPLDDEDRDGDDARADALLDEPAAEPEPAPTLLAEPEPTLPGPSGVWAGALAEASLTPASYAEDGGICGLRLTWLGTREGEPLVALRAVAPLTDEAVLLDVLRGLAEPPRGCDRIELAAPSRSSLLDLGCHDRTWYLVASLADGEPRPLEALHVRPLFRVPDVSSVAYWHCPDERLRDRLVHVPMTERVMHGEEPVALELGSVDEVTDPVALELYRLDPILDWREPTAFDVAAFHELQRGTSQRAGAALRLPPDARQLLDDVSPPGRWSMAAALVDRRNNRHAVPVFRASGEASADWPRLSQLTGLPAQGAGDGAPVEVVLEANAERGVSLVVEVSEDELDAGLLESRAAALEEAPASVGGRPEDVDDGLSMPYDELTRAFRDDDDDDALVVAFGDEVDDALAAAALDAGEAADDDDVLGALDALDRLDALMPGDGTPADALHFAESAVATSDEPLEAVEVAPPRSALSTGETAALEAAPLPQLDYTDGHIEAMPSDPAMPLVDTTASTTLAVPSDATPSEPVSGIGSSVSVPMLDLAAAALERQPADEVALGAFDEADDVLAALDRLDVLAADDDGTPADAVQFLAELAPATADEPLEPIADEAAPLRWQRVFQAPWFNRLQIEAPAGSRVRLLWSDAAQPPVLRAPEGADALDGVRVFELSGELVLDNVTERSAHVLALVEAQAGEGWTLAGVRVAEPPWSSELAHAPLLDPACSARVDAEVAKRVATARRLMREQPDAAEAVRAELVRARLVGRSRARVLAFARAHGFFDDLARDLES